MQTESDMPYGQCQNERPIKIHLKYCGGCNPEIDRRGIVKRLEKIFISNDLNVEFDFNSGGNADLRILINGCPHACLKQDVPSSAKMIPCLSIQGANVDYRSVPEKEIPEIIWERILIYLKSLQREILVSTFMLIHSLPW